MIFFKQINEGIDILSFKKESFHFSKDDLVFNFTSVLVISDVISINCGHRFSCDRKMKSKKLSCIHFNQDIIVVTLTEIYQKCV